MKSNQPSAADLEAELRALTALVRQRRKQLAFLEKCPNKNCECRAVWHEVVENNLAGQMGKIRRQVRAGAGRHSKSKGPAAKSKPRAGQK
jgi:hypothetical protein